MSVQIKQITERQLVVGEAPHWDGRTNALYFVGIPDKSIHKYDPVTEKHTETSLDVCPGFIVPVEGHGDQFAVGAGREFVVVRWDGEGGEAGEGGGARVVRLLAEVDAHKPANRINDGKADPCGRLYAGTMGPEHSPGAPELEQGSFYRLDETGITTLCDRISVSNGLAWDLAAQAMYYIDSWERKIRRYDYDIETGNISNLHYIFDFETNNLDGMPDGTTIDTDGNLWVAVFNGGCILQISPQGDLLRKIPMAVPQVTSCTFGGPELDVLFVTTACVALEGKTPPKPSGCTFMITGLGVKGHPNNSFKLT